MKRRIWTGLLVGVCILPWASGEAGPPDRSRAPRLETVTLGIRHRVFPDFREQQKVKLNQEFPIGDSEYSARIIRYVPDFQLDLEARKVFSLSDQPRNPAFQVVVRKGKAPHDTSWAFLKSPPHFGVRSYFAFQVLRIDFVGAPPLLADSSLTGPPARAATGSARAPAAADTARRK